MPVDTKRIRELEAKATARPWVINRHEYTDGGHALVDRVFGRPGQQRVGKIASNAPVGTAAGDLAEANAELITLAANQAIPLCDELEGARRLLRRAQEWLGDDVQRRVPNFLEETKLREDIADALGECMTDGCTKPQAPQDHLPIGSRHHRCAKHAPPGTLPKDAP